MNEKENVIQKNSDKWWNNWWRNRFSVPNDSDSINFHPETNFIAYKLRINSIKGFIVLIFALLLIGLGVRLGIDYFFSAQTGQQGIYQNRASQIIDSWTNFPETKIFIAGIFVVCIIGALVIWWVFYRDM